MQTREEHANSVRTWELNPLHHRAAILSVQQETVSSHSLNNGFLQKHHAQLESKP